MSQKNRERISQAIQAAFETMETRRMLSTVQVADGVLIIDADPHTASNIVVDLHAPQGRIRGSCQGVEAVFTVDEVKAIRVTGSDGDDTVLIDPALKVPTLIKAGAGNDTVRGGGGVDTIDGEAGNDTVYGGRGNDRISGGEGSDGLYGNVGDDTLDGGADDDRVYGNEGNDVLYGGEGFDLLAGMGGDDKVYGNAGDDWVYGNGGHDQLYGGTGDDRIQGQGGDDELIGGEGVDVVRGGVGKNQVRSDNDNGQEPAPDLTEAPDVAAPQAGNVSEDPAPAPEPAPAPAPRPEPVPPVVNDSPQPTPAPVPVPDTGNTGGNNTTSEPAPNSPKPVIRMIGDGDLIAGGTVHVQGLETQLHSGSVITAKFEWDFGDPTGRYNNLTGFNAAHVYEKAGVYTVTLKVTDDRGRSANATVKVNVSADDRPTVYVDSAKGDDHNDGTSPTKAVKTAERAFQIAGDDTRVLFKRGQKFTIDKAIAIKEDRVLVGAYGTGKLPVLYRVEGTGEGIFNTTSAAEDVVIEDLRFDSEYKADAKGVVGKVPVTAVYAGGTNITVRDVEFADVGNGVNANQEPTGLLVMDSNAVKEYGTRSYFVWGQGTDLVVVGNRSPNSTREHDVRTSGAERVLVAYNDFGQADRSKVDGGDIQKGCIEIHRGLYAYVTDNTVHGGVIRVGPRGGATETSDTSTDWTVVANNHCDDVGIQIYPGAHHVMVRNNAIERYESVRHGPAISLSAPTDGRIAGDVYILNNTAVESRSAGSFFKMYGAAQPGSVTVMNNLWVSPNFRAGSNGSSGVYVSEDNLASFREISGNVWATPKTTATWAKGGVNYVGSSWGEKGAYKSAKDWNSLPQVGTDYFTNDVTLKDVYQFKLHNTTVGSSLKMAA